MSAMLHEPFRGGSARLKGAGRICFYVGSLLSVADILSKGMDRDYGGVAKSGLDLVMSIVGTAGPIGFTISGMYFIIDQTIGWDNASKSYIEVEKNKAFMRSKNIMTFSDFKN